MPITRRTFLGSSALALAGMATTGKVEGLPARPQNQNNPNRPTVVSSRNGLRGVGEASLRRGDRLALRLFLLVRRLRQVILRVLVVPVAALAEGPESRSGDGRPFQVREEGTGAQCS